jgi:hypothetical protein
MTNINYVGAVIDMQTRELVQVAIGRTSAGLFHFEFRDLLWETELKEGLAMQRVLETIEWRLQQAIRKNRPAKEGSRKVGPFTVGLNENGLWYVATPTRFVYMDMNALRWMLEVMRRAVNAPRPPVQLAVQPDPEFDRERNPPW